MFALILNTEVNLQIYYLESQVGVKKSAYKNPQTFLYFVVWVNFLNKPLHSKIDRF